MDTQGFMRAWTALLGPVLGTRVGHVKAWWCLMGVVALAVGAIGVVLGTDARGPAVTMLVGAAIVLAVATLRLVLVLRHVAAEVVATLATRGVRATRPPLLRRPAFERWRAAQWPSGDELLDVLRS